MVVFPLFRLLWLHLNWNQPVEQKVEQFNIYMIIFCSFIVNLAAIHCLRKEQARTLFVINQSIKLSIEIYNMEDNERKWKKYFAYTTFTGLLTYPLIFFQIPFILNFLPLRLLLSNQFTNCFKQLWILKLVESVLYGFIETVACAHVISAYLVTLLFTEMVERLTQESKAAGFHVYYKRLQNARILLVTFNQIFSSFYSSLVIAGVILTSSCNYTLIRFYEKLPILAITAFATSVLLCISVAIVLFYIFDIPNKNLEKMKQSYAFSLAIHSVINKSRNACPPRIGYKVGIIQCVRKQFGPEMIELMVNLTSYMLLIK